MSCDTATGKVEAATDFFFSIDKTFPSSICSLAAHVRSVLSVMCPIRLPEQLGYPQPWSQECSPWAEAGCSFPHGLSHSLVVLQPGLTVGLQDSLRA